MATLVGREKDPLQAIKKLLELEYNTINAYTLAIHALKNKDWKEKLIQFKADHDRRVKAFSSVLDQKGVKVPTKPTMKQYLSKGDIIICSLLSDKSILSVIRNNEKKMVIYYQRFSGREDLENETQRMAKRAFEDEKYHAKWI